VSSNLFSRLAVVAPLLTAGLVLISNPGCNTSCDDTESGDPEVIRSGTTNATRSAYESGPWSGKYLRFRPDKHYTFIHGLSGTPAVVQAWVGFHETPLGDNDHGNISLAPGNMAIFTAITPEYVTVRNDTCETFYLRVAASDPIDAAGLNTGGTGGVPEN
jgi:hypothetical protein